MSEVIAVPKKRKKQNQTLEILKRLAKNKLAMAGIVYAGQFCQNFAFNNGHIGELHSAGTIAWMDEAVAFNVVTGSIVLGLGMLGLLLKQDEES